MKLKNKRTGEIGELQVTDKHCAVAVGNGTASCGIEIYSSLARLYEEWEDMPEEPEEYWRIDCDGEIEDDEYEGTSFDKDCKAIGNYFETKEEAELAVRKLKAWKRLKDKCFRFYRWNKGSLLKSLPNTIEFACDDTKLWSWEDIQDDLDLLFGGEE